MSDPVWFAEKGVIVAGGRGGRRMTVCNGHGRPDVSIACELVSLHNDALRQLEDDLHAGAIALEQLERRLADVEDTRDRAQSEATRQIIMRQDLQMALRKALRLSPAGDAIAAIYRLQRLADAARGVLRSDAEERS